MMRPTSTAGNTPSRWALILTLALSSGQGLAMATRNAGTPNHWTWDVPGVAHSGNKMLTSPCGLAALFDLPGCAAER